MTHLSACKCGEIFGLFIRDNRWWCSPCVWKEVEQLRSVIIETFSLHIYSDETMIGRKEVELSDEVRRTIIETIQNNQRASSVSPPDG